jgi:hypothetical protein
MKLSTSQKEQAVTLYLIGTTPPEIARLTGVKGGSLYRALDEFGVKVRQEGPKRLLRTNEVDAMALYEAGEKISNIERKTGVGSDALYKLINRRGNGSDRGRKRLKYEIARPDYFSGDISTDEQGYFLGLAFADGHVKHGRTGIPESFEITLTRNDEYILEKFRLAIGHQKPIEQKIPVGTCFQNSKPNSRMVVTCKKICEDLLRLGVTLQKPFNSRANNFLGWNDAAARGFLRGAFDGNGTVAYSHWGDKLRSPTLTWLGSEAFCRQVSQYWHRNGLALRPIAVAHKKTNLCAVRYHRLSDISLICAVLYCAESAPCLNRKKEKVERLVRYYVERDFSNIHNLTAQK